ncbi:magnesium transporter [Microbacterium sorbitolivorans]|uniref:Magnesium and cobalt transport protein CorA n=2 Tax=Microbacterium sorbitolivorans TaxID=1867410 RepID=A0A367Y6C2_9MICO|nr:magnesium and cobalt transport protein CorA [Microbacterium sorbitolivorans]GGF34259.1 magnesium transporter [Microbacterium sorbitolivorans]
MSMPRNAFRRANRAAEVPTGSTRLTRYVADGRASIPDPGASVADGLAFAAAGEGRMALFLYAAPTPEEIAELASAWELHPVLVEDLVHAGQRPKLERYGDVMFLVIRSAHYVDETEEVDFAEFHVLVKHGAVAVLCQDGRWIDGSDGVNLLVADEHDRALLSDDEFLRRGPEAVVYRLIDAIVDGYIPVLQGIAIDKEQIERQVFSGERSVTERIYRLNLEVIEMQQTTAALDEVIDSLRAGFRKYGVDERLQTYLQDVSDHLARANSRVAEYRAALSQILDVNSTLVAQRQNEDMKKISGWAAIFFVPSLVAAIYGMNFRNMPELDWEFGYPFAIGLMLLLTGCLYLVFKWKKWL